MTALAVINQKGGVGKSTTAAAIGAGLALKGYSVLFIDLDSQGNLTDTMNADSSGMSGYSSLEVLELKASAAEAIQHTEQGDVIASSPALAGADMAIANDGKGRKEYRLADALEALAGRYDYVVIDTPPALGIITINALTACDRCIIPAQADVYSLRGITQLMGTIQTVKQYCNPALLVDGILLTRYSNRAIISRDVAEKIDETASQLQTRLYSTRIRECTALKEAQAVKQDIFTYSPRSNAAADYRALVDEILKEANHNG